MGSGSGSSGGGSDEGKTGGGGAVSASGSDSGFGSGAGGPGGGSGISPRLVVLAGRKGTPSLLPFVAVLLVLGLVGLLALLFLNTELNKGAFTIKQQKATATKLEQENEQIQQSLNGLNGPGALASKASEMGMVPNPNPAFLAPNGSVLGSPTAVPTPTPSGSAPTANGAAPGAAVAPTTPTPAPHNPPPTPKPAPTPTGAGR